MFAAASLNETFTELGKQFETDNPGVTVRFNFAGSSDLAQQIVNGAPADVFAAASDATMKTVTDGGQAAGEPAIFAKNVLQIATAPGNPKGIATFADLARPELKVVVCAPQVPCGAAADKIEQATGVTLDPGQRGARRQVHPGQGHLGGRGRRPGLRDRRGRGRPGGAGRQLPGGRPGHHQLPDRGHRRRPAARAGRQVPAAGDRRGRAEDAGRPPASAPRDA